MLKNRIRKNFSKLPNAVIEDKSLSANAKTLFWYLASRPEYWIFNNKNIQETLGVKNPKTISKYIKELLDSGWISRGRTKDINGKLTGGYDYIINETPFAKDWDSKDSAQNLNTLLNSDFVQEINSEEAIEKTLEILPEETKKFAQDFENKSLVSQSVSQDILHDLDTKNATYNASKSSKNTNLEDKSRITKFSVLVKNGAYNNKEFINKNKYIKKIKKINKKTKKDLQACNNSQTQESKQPISKSKTNSQSEILSLTLPLNVGREMWAEFVAFRAEIKKPLTLRGAKMALNELGKFDPAMREQALRQSIIHNWSGIYEPKANANVGNKNSFIKTNSTDPSLLKKLEEKGISLLDVVRGKEVYIDNQRVIATRKPQGNYVLSLENHQFQGVKQ